MVLPYMEMEMAPEVATAYLLPYTRVGHVLELCSSVTEPVSICEG